MNKPEMHKVTEDLQEGRLSHNDLSVIMLNHIKHWAEIELPLQVVSVLISAGGLLQHGMHLKSQRNIERLLAELEMLPEKDVK